MQSILCPFLQTLLGTMSLIKYITHLCKAGFVLFPCPEQVQIQNSPECNHSAYISNGTSVIGPQQSSKDSEVECFPWDLINSSLPPDGQYFIVCQSVPSKTTTVAPLLAESQLGPGAAALYESKTLPTGTILSRKQQLVLRIGWCPRSCYLHLNNWVDKGAASPLLGQSAFY